MAKRRNKNKKAGPVKIIRPTDPNPAAVAEAPAPVDEAGAPEPAVEELAASVDESPAMDAVDEPPAAGAEADAQAAGESAHENSETAVEDAVSGDPVTEAMTAEAAGEAAAPEEMAAVEVERSEASADEQSAPNAQGDAGGSTPSVHEFEDASALLAHSIDVEPAAGQSARTIESIPIHDESAEAEAASSAEPVAGESTREEQRGGKRKLKLNKLQKHARSELDVQPEAEPEPAPPVEPEPERRGPSEPRIAAFAKLTEYQTLSLAHVAGLPEEADVPGHWRGVGFGIGGRRFVAGFDEVVEVIRMPQITHVPGTQPWMLGVANVRGTLLPVVDLKQFLEGERTVMYEGQRVMVVRQSGGNVAVLIDQLFGQRAFNDAQKVAADPDAGTRYGHFIKQVYRVGDNDWGVFSMLMLTRTPEFRQAAV